MGLDSSIATKGSQRIKLGFIVGDVKMVKETLFHRDSI